MKKPHGSLSGENGEDFEGGAFCAGGKKKWLRKKKKKGEPLPDFSIKHTLAHINTPTHPNTRAHAHLVF